MLWDKKPKNQGEKGQPELPRPKVHHRIGEKIGLDLHSAEEGAKIFMYEGLGRLLANKLANLSPPLLAAAAALKIDPEEQDVIAHLANGLLASDVQIAAGIFGEKVKELQLNYRRDDLREWKLRINCIVFVDGEVSHIASERKLDYSSLPDAVREGFMKTNSTDFVITLIGGSQK